MPAADKSDDRASNVCYVYLLLKTPITEPPVIGGFDLANVLYVGKGTGYRWREHFHDALKAVDSPKAAAIREALGADPSSEVIERHALVVAGHLSEIEAYRMEAVMLHLVGGPRAVTNIVAGHRSPELMVPAYDARVFFGAQDLAVDYWQVSGDGRLLQADLLDGGPPGAVVFVVKGTAESFAETSWRHTGEAGRWRASALMTSTDEPAPNRRGWDPHQPWPAEEARERARKYWSGSKASIELWQDLIVERSGYLALVVPDRRDGRSVVRYVWTLEPGGEWEDYGSTWGFGFPMGQPMGDHPWLGKHLMDRATGRGFLKSPSSPGVAVCEASDIAG